MTDVWPQSGPWVWWWDSAGRCAVVVMAARGRLHIGDGQQFDRLTRESMHDLKSLPREIDTDVRPP